MYTYPEARSHVYYDERNERQVPNNEWKWPSELKM